MDRNAVIKGLEECLSASCRSFKPGIYCPISDETWNNIRDALALLKAQEPRVMTLDEAANAECVFYDWRTRGVRPAKVTRVPYKTGTYRVQRFGDIDEWVHADEYGEYWRCWTSLPTDEQREAEPWK